jgi:hypothetical protein
MLGEDGLAAFGSSSSAEMSPKQKTTTRSAEKNLLCNSAKMQRPFFSNPSQNQSLQFAPMHVRVDFFNCKLRAFKFGIAVSVFGNHKQPKISLLRYCRIKSVVTFWPLSVSLSQPHFKPALHTYLQWRHPNYRPSNCQNKKTENKN